MDTTSGTLSPATTDSLFTVVLAKARTLGQDDYGTTRNGADMMFYTIRLTADGRTRTDDRGRTTADARGRPRTSLGPRGPPSPRRPPPEARGAPAT